MTISYNWKILQMLTNPSLDGLTDVVVSATWSAEAENVDNSNPDMANIITAAVGGTASFGQPSSTDFTQYADLTQEQVLQWVWASGVNKDSVEAELLKKVTPNPDVILPNPWGSQ